MYKMTPLIEKVLSIVRTKCDPRAPNWPDRLAEELWQTFYAISKPNDATSEVVDVIVRRLVALEIDREKPSQSEGRRPNEHTN